MKKKQEIKEQTPEEKQKAEEKRLRLAAIMKDAMQKSGNTSSLIVVSKIQEDK